MRRALFSISGFVLLGLSQIASGGETPRKSTRELFDYIQAAHKLGLSDDQIRTNALNAGWDQASVALAYEHRAKLKETAGSPAGSLEDYRIGAGDILQIIVWREPEASAEAAVRADGKITLPLIKEMTAVGLTPGELENVLAQRFAKVITEPDVTVIPKQVNSRKVYMIGAVRKEGPLPLAGPMTVLQAINEAGGLNDYAKRKRIYILREQDGKQARIPFDYSAVLKGEHIEQNIRLLPGDSVVVPQ